MRQEFIGRYFCKVAGVIVLLLPIGLADGSVTYTYTGRPFTTVVGNVQPGDSLTISVTLSEPLLAAQSDQVVTPLSWSFSDGVTADTLTNSNNTYIFEGFEFRTNTAGDIIGWALGANAGNKSAFSWTANNWKIFGGVTTLDEYYEGTNVSLNQAQPGAWTSISTIPEPASALLTILPGALLVLAYRKKMVA